MLRIIYQSRIPAKLGPAEIDRLIDQSRQSNAAHDITGILIQARHSFLQVLEGPDAAVAACFARIEADSRHDQIKVLDRQDGLSARAFCSWFMSYARTDNFEIATKEVVTINAILAQMERCADLRNANCKKGLVRKMCLFLEGLEDDLHVNTQAA